MEKLTKSSKKFHDIQYIIWKLMVYYADYFGYDAADLAHDLYIKLFYDKTLTKIRVSVPRIQGFNTPYTVNDMRIIMNEYLQLLLQDSDLPPFAAGKNYYEIVEPLYITIIVTNGHYYDFDFLYVDNLDAYRTVKESRTENIISII